MKLNPLRQFLCISSSDVENFNVKKSPLAEREREREADEIAEDAKWKAEERIGNWNGMAGWC